MFVEVLEKDSIDCGDVRVTVAIDSKEPKGFPANCEATVPNIGIVASSL
jgi:hypothetical protein